MSKAQNSSSPIPGNVGNPAERSPLQIAVAVVEQRGLFLAALRPDDVALGGYWEFPGGKVEPRETPLEAAVRECLEETSLKVEVVETYPTRDQQYEHGRLRLHFFACRPCEVGQIAKQPFVWLSREELARCRFPAGNQDLLRILLASS